MRDPEAISSDTDELEEIGKKSRTPTETPKKKAAGGAKAFADKMKKK